LLSFIVNRPDFELCHSSLKYRHTPMKIHILAKFGYGILEALAYNVAENRETCIIMRRGLTAGTEGNGF